MLCLQSSLGKPNCHSLHLHLSLNCTRRLPITTAPHSCCPGHWNYSAGQACHAPSAAGAMASVPHGVTGPPPHPLTPRHKPPTKDTHVWLIFPPSPKLPPWFDDYIKNCLCSWISVERDAGKDNQHSLTLLASESWHSGSCFHFLCTFLHCVLS